MFREELSFLGMEELRKQYEETLYAIEEAKKLANDEERVLFTGMISDLQYAIEWMLTGKRPGNKRGIERRAAYQREKPFDPLVMQKYFRSIDTVDFPWVDQEQSNQITDSDRARINEALLVLTDKEKEMYLMSRGHCLSYSQIASYLKITKSTVQKTVERAEKKIGKQIHESLFCLT
jgi:positive control factor